MKNLLFNSEKDHLDEVVFANRNKAYGAYALRNDYSSQLTKAFLVGVAFFASLSVVPLVISSFDTQAYAAPKDKIYEFVPIDEEIDIPKPQPAATVPQDIKTVENPDYTPVRHVKKDKPLPTKQDFEGAAIGSETKPGVETTIPIAPPISTGPPAATVPYTAPVVPAEDPNKLISQNDADVAADFKGGINSFRQKVAQTFDTSSVDQGGMVSATISFIVERDGSISNIKVTGSNSDFNQEAERTVKSIKSKWTPAQLKGKTVRSSFRMPISMKID